MWTMNIASSQQAFYIGTFIVNHRPIYNSLQEAAYWFHLFLFAILLFVHFLFRQKIESNFVPICCSIHNPSHETLAFHPSIGLRGQEKQACVQSAPSGSPTPSSPFFEDDPFPNPTSPKMRMFKSLYPECLLILNHASDICAYARFVIPFVKCKKYM